MKKIDTIYGDMVADIPENDLILRCLNEYGEWGLLECYFASKILKPGYVAVDVGAFIGTFSLGLSMFGAGKLITVEPNSQVLPSLRKNLAVNAKIPFDLIEAPLGLNDGRAWALSVESDNLGGSHLVEANAGDDGAIGIVELKDLRTKYGDYDFLKIDAEGHEWDIIKSDETYIAKKCQVIFLEENDDSNHEQLIEYLIENQFYTYMAIFPAFNPNNYKSSKNRLLNIAREANVIATRKDISMDDTLKNLGCELIRFSNLEQFNKMRLQIPRWGCEEWENMTNVRLMGIICSLLTILKNDYKHDVDKFF